ncbi:uncharacterized protein VP01_533g6 [Puccinia sorghi]|uniref:Protein CPL1-like domain-containing protein n=1 Tax=Puccinia sorghi TaxID=27349 RepID=A0A0L6UK61_9BASI|nr:uncharacterized protein VP01_533g6 [Puccinia sorghi]
MVMPSSVTTIGSGQLQARSAPGLSSITGVSAGESLQGQFGAKTGMASAGCGLETNVWGQVSPVSSSGYANLCLQCRVNVFGVQIVNFNFYSALAASISAHGVSAHQVAVLQSSIDDDLLRLSAGARTSASCSAACAGDQRCRSSSFVAGSCRLQSVNYATQNRAGAPLAQACQELFSRGGSGYCSICPSDRSCGGPAPSGLPRRNVPESSALSNCPSGLTACPIATGPSLSPSGGFECLDVQQEVTSCGGCSSTGQGVDCTTLKGVSSAGCSAGECKIFSCKPGFQFSFVNNACYKSHRSSKMS